MDIPLKKTLLLAGLILALTACMPPEYFEPIQTSNSSNAIVYIYRPKADNPGRQPLKHSYPDILLDEKNLGPLKFNSYLATELSAGEHHIRVTGLTKTANWETRDIEQDISLAPGQTKYLKLDVRFNMNEMNLGQPGPKYIIYLTPVSPEDAVYEIRETEGSN
jgi:hypothetical protein